MARRTTATQTPQPAQLSVEQIRQAIPRLRKRIDEIQAFDPSTVDARNPSASTQPLGAAIADSLVRTFGPDTVEYRRYQPAAEFHWPMFYDRPTPSHQISEGLTRSKERSLGLLKEAVRALEERLEEAGPSPGPTGVVQAIDPENRRVFLVHGHDVAAREAVARFVEQIELAGC